MTTPANYDGYKSYISISSTVETIGTTAIYKKVNVIRDRPNDTPTYLYQITTNRYITMPMLGNDGCLKYKTSESARWWTTTTDGSSLVNSSDDAQFSYQLSFNPSLCIAPVDDKTIVINGVVTLFPTVYGPGEITGIKYSPFRAHVYSFYPVKNDTDKTPILDPRATKINIKNGEHFKLSIIEDVYIETNYYMGKKPPTLTSLIY